jgi:colicin import membrane protein
MQDAAHPRRLGARCGLPLVLAALLASAASAHANDAAGALADRFAQPQRPAARPLDPDAVRKAAEARRRAEEERLRREAERRRTDERDMLARARAEAEERRRALAAAEAAAAAAEADLKAATEKAEAEERLIAAAKAADDARREAEARAAEEAETARRAALERERDEETARLAEKLRRIQAARGRPPVPVPAPEADVAISTPPTAPEGPAPLPLQLPRETPPVATAPSADARSAIAAPAPASPAEARSGATASASVTLPRRVSVLLVLEPGKRGIRRYNKLADPLLCGPTGCYVSAGPLSAARFFAGYAAYGAANTLGSRAGACNNRLGCVFRNVDLEQLEGMLQPVDMRLLRHDRREARRVSTDSNCRILSGHLSCTRPVEGPDYRIWVVPETVAAEAGPDALEKAVAEGLAMSVSAALTR